MALVNLGATLYFMPYAIKRLKERQHLISDRYKNEITEIPTHGAAIVVFTSFLVCSLFPLFIGIINRISYYSIPLAFFDEIDLLTLCRREPSFAPWQ